MTLTPDLPNIIWIIADQFRGQALSLRGDPNVSTGAYFPQACREPRCAPRRAARSSQAAILMDENTTENSVTATGSTPVASTPTPMRRATIIVTWKRAA